MRQRDIPIRQRIVRPSRFQTAQPSVQISKPLPPGIETIKGIGRGKHLNVLACGPSLLEVQLDKLEGDTMCVNKPLPELNPKFWLLMDDNQRRRNLDKWDRFTGTILSGYSIKGNRRPNQIMIPQADGQAEAFGFIDGYVWVGKSSTYVALQLAAFMDYDSIDVYGLDMCKVGSKLHFYGINPDVTEEYRVPRFDQESYAFDWAATHVPWEIRRKFTFKSPYNKRDWVQKWSTP